MEKIFSLMNVNSSSKKKDVFSFFYDVNFKGRCLNITAVIFFCLLVLPVAASGADNGKPAEKPAESAVTEIMPEQAKETEPKKTLHDYNAEAVQLFSNGKLEMALDRMYKAIEQEPRNAEYHYNLALMLYKSGSRYVAAKKACENGLEIEPNNKNLKVLLKGCIDKIVQEEGIKNDTSLASSKYLEVQHEIKTNNDNLPDELRSFLKFLYLEKNYEEAYTYFSEGAKKAITQAEYVAHCKEALNESLIGVPHETKVVSIKLKEKEGYGVAKYEVIYEKEIKQPLRAAFGDYTKVKEKRKNFIFFMKEADKWVVLPPDFMVDKYMLLCSKFPDVINYVGAQLYITNDWRDSDLVELEKMAEFLESKKPDEALKSRIMFNALNFLKAWKDKNYSQMYDFISPVEYKMIGSKFDFIKTKTREDLKLLIHDIKINEIQHKSRIACIKFTIQLFNNVDSEHITMNKLTSYLMVVKDGVDWKIADLWRSNSFLSKYPEVFKEFNPLEDQYLEFNGRDWVDRSMEYNSDRREMIKSLESKSWF